MPGKQGYGSIKFEAFGALATTVPWNWGRIVLSGFLSGLVGGVFFDAFVAIVGLLPAHASTLSLAQIVASAGFGRPAYLSTSSALAAIALHFLMSVGWGIGYAFTASTHQAINKNPVISGFFFGIVVYVVMLLVFYTLQSFKTTDPLDVYVSVVAYTVFFGVPIALIARVK
jgi:hypothetical protein